MLIQNQLICVGMLLFAQVAAAQGVDSDYEQKRRAIIVQWNELFGDKLDFSSRRFFTQMSVVGARPLTEFIDFEGKERASGLKNETERWLREFFTEEYRPAKEPEKYYLRTGNERSVLYYRWSTNDFQFAMFESDSGVLLEITSVDGKAIRPDSKELEHILDTVLSPEFNQDAMASFNLEGIVDEGVAITNADDFTGLDFGDWRRTIIVFGSSRGLCILLLKAMPGRASVQLPKNPLWLEHGLRDAD